MFTKTRKSDAPRASKERFISSFGVRRASLFFCVFSSALSIPVVADPPRGTRWTVEGNRRGAQPVQRDHARVVPLKLTNLSSAVQVDCSVSMEEFLKLVLAKEEGVREVVRPELPARAFRLDEYYPGDAPAIVANGLDFFEPLFLEQRRRIDQNRSIRVFERGIPALQGRSNGRLAFDGQDPFRILNGGRPEDQILPVFEPREDVALKWEFRLAVLGQAAKCQPSSIFRKTLNKWLENFISPVQQLRLGRDRVHEYPFAKHIWKDFQNTLLAVDNLVGHSSGPTRLSFGWGSGGAADEMPTDILNAMIADIQATGTETVAQRTRKLGEPPVSISELQLAKFAQELHEALKGKKFVTHADIIDAAKTRQQIALARLLFERSAKGAVLADILLGGAKANYLRNIVLLGALPRNSEEGYSQFRQRIWGEGPKPTKTAQDFANAFQDLQRRDIFGSDNGWWDATRRLDGLDGPNRIATRAYLQEVLERLERSGVASSWDLADTLAAENLRTKLHQALMGLDRNIPSTASGTIQVASENVGEESMPAILGHGWSSLLDGEDTMFGGGAPSMMGEANVPASPTHIAPFVLPGAQQGPSHAGPSAQIRPTPKRRGHGWLDDTITKYRELYGRELSSERDAPHQAEVQRVALALEKVANLGAEERQRLATAKLSTLALLEELAKHAKFERDLPHSSMRRGRERFTPSLEEIRDMANEPIKFKDRIFAVAAMSRLGTGDDATTLKFLASRFELAKIPGIAAADFTRLAGMSGAGATELAEILRGAVEKLLQEPDKIPDPDQNREFLLLASIVLRERNQSIDALLADPPFELLEHYKPANQQGLHYSVGKLHERLKAEAADPAVKNAAHGLDALRRLYVADNRGMPLGTELAISKLFETVDGTAFGTLSQAHSIAPKEGFHEAMMTNSRSPELISERMSGLLAEYSPETHYASSDERFQLYGTASQAIQEIINNGKLSPESLENIGILLTRYGQCLKMADEKGNPLPLRLENGDLNPAVLNCVSGALAGDAAYILLAQNDEAKAADVLKKILGEAAGAEKLAQIKGFHDGLDEVRKRAGAAVSDWSTWDAQSERTHEVPAQTHLEQQRVHTILEQALSRERLHFATAQDSLARQKAALAQERAQIQQQVQQLKENKGGGFLGRQQTSEELKAAEAQLKSVSDRLHGMENEGRTKALMLLHAATAVDGTRIWSSSVDQPRATADFIQLVGAVLGSEDPALNPIRDELQGIVNSLATTGRLERDGKPLDAAELDALIQRIRAVAPSLVGSYTYREPMAGTLEERYEALKSACLNPGATVACPFACTPEEENTEACGKKQEAIGALKALETFFAEKPKEGEPPHSLAAHGLIDDKTQDLNARMERQIGHSALAEALLFTARRDASLRRKSAVSEALLPDMADLDPVVQKLASFRMRQANDINEWGHAIADAVASFDGHAPNPNLPEADFRREAKKWMESPEMAHLRKNFAEWRYLASSGYGMSPKGRNGAEDFFYRMVQKAMQEGRARRVEISAIEEELSKVVQPSGRRNPTEELWNWSEAELFRLAPKAGENVPATWTADQLYKRGYTMTQDRFRTLLNRYAYLKGPPSLRDHHAYRASGLGEAEFDRIIDKHFEEAGTDHRAVPINENSGAEIVGSGADASLKFVNNDHLKRLYGPAASEVAKWVSPNGKLQKLMTKAGWDWEAFVRFELAVHQGFQGVRAPLGNWFGEHSYTYGSYDPELTKTLNDRELEEMKDRIIWAIAGLRRLGSEEIDYEDPQQNYKKVKKQAHELAAELSARLGVLLNTVGRETAAKQERAYNAADELNDFAATYGLVKLLSAPVQGTQWFQRARAGWLMSKGAQLAAAGHKSGMPMLLASTAIWGGWSGWNSYKLYVGRRETEALHAKLDRDRDGVDDWLEALESGRPYTFCVLTVDPKTKKQVCDASKSVLSKDEAASIDKDGNGIPDWYEISQMGRPLHHFVFGEELPGVYEDLRNGYLMGAANPFVTEGLNLVAKPLLRWKNSQRMLDYWEKFNGYAAQMIIVGGVQLAQGQNILSVSGLASIAVQSMVMFPGDDLMANMYLKRGMMRGTSQESLQRGTGLIKSLFNHVAVDAVAQPATDLWLKGAYQTRTGEQITDPWLASVYSFLEGFPMSRRASRADTALMDQIPKIIASEFIYRGQTAQLDYKVKMPSRDANGNAITVEQTVREIIAKQADLGDFLAPERMPQFMILYGDTLQNAGIPVTEIQSRVRAKMDSLPWYKRQYMEASDFVREVIEDNKLARLAAGKEPFLKIKRDTYELDVAAIRPNTVFTPAPRSEWIPVHTLIHHRLQVGDIVRTATGKFNNNEVRLAVRDVAKTYGIDPDKMEAEVLQRAARGDKVDLARVARDILRAQKPDLTIFQP